MAAIFGTALFDSHEVWEVQYMEMQDVFDSRYSIILYLRHVCLK